MITISKYDAEKYNLDIQEYNGVFFRLILYTESHFARLRAKRFIILDPSGIDSGQNFWIPNSCLEEDGTVIKSRIGWIFRKAELNHKLHLAGYSSWPLQMR